MPIELATLTALAETCAPSVHASTLIAVVKTESGFEPLAIGVNGKAPRSLLPSTVDEAVQTASALIKQGRSIDLGLGQINSANLAGLGYTVADAFDPCRNLAGSAAILARAYRPSEGAGALSAALSRYNTGHPVRGLANGYVAKVRKNAQQLALAAPRATNEAPRPRATDVFSSASAQARLVFQTSVNGGQP